MLKIKSKPPSLRFLFSHPAHLIACGFGSGLSPIAPGTFGSLFALLTFPLLRTWMNDIVLYAFLLASFIIGVYAAQKTSLDYGKDDPGCIVWDEIVPLWFVLAFCPVTVTISTLSSWSAWQGWLWPITAFLLFRFFDILKPPPARYFDEKVKNGFGIMTDDLFAALYTLAVLYVLGWMRIL